MKQRKPNNWRRRAAIALVVSALGAPGVVANAGTDTVARPGAFDSGIPGGGYVPSNSAPPPAVFDSGVPGGGYIPEDAAPVVALANPGGFDWTTLAVGLGAGLAGLAAGAAVALTMRRRTPQRV
jgi:hypothetical protein